jgi:hypothetical protein
MAETDAHVTDRVDVRGKRAIVAIDFRHARIYAVDAPGHSAPEGIGAKDPWHLDHNLYHRAGNPDGHYDIDAIDTDKFLAALAAELQGADEILLLGHGKGKSNASHLFEAYLEKHHRDLAARIVGNIRMDIDDITDNQLLRLGQMAFDEDVPVRDSGDSRRGIPGDP